MNPKTRVINLVGCEICEAHASQFHHYFPATRGGEKTGSKSGLNLCPNHHHMANALQLQIERITHRRGCMPDELHVDDFSGLNLLFDEGFRRAIPMLLMGYDIGRRESLVSMGVYE